MRKGSHHTAKAKAKMSVAHAAHAGRKPSPEERARRSSAALGNQHRLGTEVSKETREKISAARKGHEVSPVTREKISASRRGPNYRTRGSHYAKVYEDSWGQIPGQDNGRTYNIHHRDGNRQNDDPDNLIALTNSEHAALEHALQRGDWGLAAEIDAVGVSRRVPNNTHAKAR